MLRALQGLLAVSAMLMLTLLATKAWADLLIGAPKKLCDVAICFKSTEDQEAFERANRCVFGSYCGPEIIKSSTQCCGTNAFSGKPEPQPKVATALDPDFNWDWYKKRCPAMRQSEAPPNDTWQQCVAGKKHSADDDYAVVSVEANGNARSYCIDGCSTPPGVVDKLFTTGIFIFRDKDNPSGNGPGGFGASSSFYGSCASHDKCYQTCTGNDQKTCDDRLLADMLAVCATIPAAHETTVTNIFGNEVSKNTRKKCQSAADTMHTGLRAPVQAAKIAFKTRRQQYCQCC
jgi:hypothetical protein